MYTIFIWFFSKILLNCSVIMYSFGQQILTSAKDFSPMEFEKVNNNMHIAECGVKVLSAMKI